MPPRVKIGKRARVERAVARPRRMTTREMVALDADALSGQRKVARPVAARETQAELLRGAAANLSDWLDEYGDEMTTARRAVVGRQIAMCEKAADDVERLAEALSRMATP